MIPIVSNFTAYQVSRKMRGVSKLPGVYRIICRPTGESYIGSSKNIFTRGKSHFYSAIAANHHSELFQKAFDTYGLDCFSFIVLELCNADILLPRELHWFRLLGSELSMQPPQTTIRQKQNVVVVDSLCERLRKALAADTRSCRDVANLSGVNFNTIHRFRKGRSISAEKLEQLADFLGFDIVLEPLSQGNNF